ncbi:helix-turn-helix domain-containing protein [Chryseobacterium scophthalmum]|uniref:helix-turn-helix domain-containing protein n=1 Tax=Chryseobacterium scophthalmum TaxID=59733 RepID=UPI003D06EFAB
MQKYTFEMLPTILARIETRLEKIENFILVGGKQEQLTDYISSKEAAKLLKFTLPTLYTKVCKGEVPSYKQGNRLYFSRAELNDWIERGKKETLEDIAEKACNISRNIFKDSI